MAPAVCRRALTIAARNWLWGSITFTLPSGHEIPIRGAEPGPNARVFIRDLRCLRRVMTAADIGFAEGYLAGEWDTPDLISVLESVSLNFDRLSQLANGAAWKRVVNYVVHLLRVNTPAGARRNIHAHYDLGNAFYARWLDSGMTYSAAWFGADDETLEQAHRNKYVALATRMDLKPGHRVLELGCGWGGFAEFAALELDVHVTAVTISRAQYEFAKRRLFEAGLADRVDVRLADYRDIEGDFDRVASIEMFEAVGERYWPAYFESIRARLKPGGLAGLQVITIRDELFEHYRGRADFIQKYVFPGGMLPSEARLREETERAGLDWRGAVRFGEHYAHTLHLWRERFEAQRTQIASLGFDERFYRLWRFYLSYCEAGFRTGRTNVVQLVLAKP